MIVTDRSRLQIACAETSIGECQDRGVFTALRTELSRSQIPGVGLAANQIGILLRACIVHLHARNKPVQIINMVNPKIVDKYDLIIYKNEGCLSFPGVRLNTHRFDHVVCEWTDFDTGECRKAVFYNCDDHPEEAIVIQHELDHLDGITFFSRVAEPSVKVGRNDPCPCGSGKKYKKCCLG